MRRRRSPVLRRLALPLSRPVLSPRAVATGRPLQLAFPVLSLAGMARVPMSGVLPPPLLPRPSGVLLMPKTASGRTAQLTVKDNPCSRGGSLRKTVVDLRTISKRVAVIFSGKTYTTNQTPRPSISCKIQKKVDIFHAQHHFSLSGSSGQLDGTNEGKIPDLVLPIWSSRNGECPVQSKGWT